MRIQKNMLTNLISISGLAVLISCGQTGSTPTEIDRDSNFDSQHLSSENSDSNNDEELLEDTVASKPETISGMYLSDVHITCSQDPNIDAPTNHSAIGCLALDANEEVFDINSAEDVSYAVASGSSEKNPKDSVVTLRENDDKEDYEKNYWSMTMIAPLKQETIEIAFTHPDKKKVKVEVKVHQSPTKENKNAWKKEGLSTPKVFEEEFKSRKISSLHGEDEA
ncbi:MAG: hypothetical protein AB8C84_10840 [Oligoflexales bacterium]